MKQKNTNYLRYIKPKNAFLWMALLFIFMGIGKLNANYIQVYDVSLVGQNTSQNYSMVKFDLSWDNSWRLNTAPYNWDAAWVFVKYRRKISNVWHHARLHYVDGTGSNDGHVVPSNAQIESWDDNSLTTYSGTSNGVMIYRNSAASQSTVIFDDIKLRWDYGVDGLTDQDSVEIAVYAIEMVYVRQGAFDLGSGGTEKMCFTKFPTGHEPYKVMNENAISSQLGQLTSVGISQMPTIPSNYPKGYNAFYCMKYEITNAQVVDFINKLTASQNNSYYWWGSSNYAYSAAISGSPVGPNIGAGDSIYTTSKPFHPAEFQQTRQFLAYLDWAALRPMTEFEYEKACRGNAPALPNEFVWGTNFICVDQYSISNYGLNYESISNNYSTIYGNCNYGLTTLSSNTQKRFRVGIFSSNSLNTGRVSSGATIYGIMEMAGNVWELVINAEETEGLSYQGKHGRGVLDINGYAITSTWPDANGPLDMPGIGSRGGSYSNYYGKLRISDRDEKYNSARSGRGVRSAP